MGGFFVDTAHGEPETGNGDGFLLPFLEGGNDHSSVMGIGLVVLVIILSTVLGMSAWEQKKRRQGLSGRRSIDHLFLKIRFEEILKGSLSVYTQVNKVASENSKNLVVPKNIGTKSASRCSYKEHCGGGYLRSLGVGLASFICDYPYPKTTLINLDLSSLPKFPLIDLKVKSEVIGCKSLGGTPQCYLINLKFDPNQHSDDIKKYLDYLTKNHT